MENPKDFACEALLEDGGVLTVVAFTNKRAEVTKASKGLRVDADGIDFDGESLQWAEVSVLLDARSRSLTQQETLGVWAYAALNGARRRPHLRLLQGGG